MKKKRVTEVAEEGKLWAVGLAGGERGVIPFGGLGRCASVNEGRGWGDGEVRQERCRGSRMAKPAFASYRAGQSDRQSLEGA